MSAVESEDQSRERGGLGFGIVGLVEGGEGGIGGREVGGPGEFGDGVVKVSMVVWVDVVARYVLEGTAKPT